MKSAKLANKNATAEAKAKAKAKAKQDAQLKRKLQRKHKSRIYLSFARKILAHITFLATVIQMCITTLKPEFKTENVKHNNARQPNVYKISY